MSTEKIPSFQMVKVPRRVLTILSRYWDNDKGVKFIYYLDGQTYKTYRSGNRPYPEDEQHKPAWDEKRLDLIRDGKQHTEGIIIICKEEQMKGIMLWLASIM